MTKKPFFFTLIWSMIIVLLCSIPGNLFKNQSLGQSIPIADKIVHWGLFAVWALIFYLERNIRNVKNKGITSSVLIVLIIGTVFGILIEGWQWIIPWGRNAEMLDVLADFIGLISGVAAFFIIRPNKC